MAQMRKVVGRRTGSTRRKRSIRVRAVEVGIAGNAKASRRVAIPAITVRKREAGSQREIVGWTRGGAIAVSCGCHLFVSVGLLSQT